MQQKLRTNEALVLVTTEKAAELLGVNRMTLWRHREQFTDITIQHRRWFVVNELMAWRDRRHRAIVQVSKAA